MTNRKHTRRVFFKNMGLIGAAVSLPSGINTIHAKAPKKKSSKTPKFEIGVASYGLRALSFEELVEAMKTLQIKNLSLKSMHLPFDLSTEEIKKRMKIMRDADLNPYAPGVVYMKTKEEVEARFAYTKAAGMKMIVAVPNYELIDLVNEKIKETDISIAIHCHGPDNLPYPSPEDAYNRIKHCDPRFGICVDLAHVIRSKMDPVQQLKLVQDRLLDVHIRDLTEAAKEGHSCRPGTGVFNFKESLQTLIDIDYSGFISIEYEAEKNSPLAGHAETKGFINGALNSLI